MIAQLVGVQEVMRYSGLVPIRLLLLAAVPGGSAWARHALRFVLEWALGPHSLALALWLGEQGTLLLSWLVCIGAVFGPVCIASLNPGIFLQD
jgi:hypothetical protein